MLIFDYEYVQRARIENIFLDLDHIPERWIHERVPPEVDQKLFEAEVLYDRDGTLQQAKDLISNIYLKPARVEIRTGNYLMEADTYLSRGLSAYNKDDFQSAKVNGVIGLDAIMKILIEVNRLPISNSRFVRAVESSTKRFGAPQLYDEYVKIAGLSKLPRERAEGMLDSVLVMWKEALEFFEANSASVERLHVRVMKDLSYYCRDSFVRVSGDWRLERALWSMMACSLKLLITCFVRRLVCLRIMCGWCLLWRERGLTIRLSSRI
jgi:hypothetical protein